MTAIEYDLAFWTAFKKAGYAHVVLVGISGKGRVSGRISRVTSRNVFVRFAGRPEPVHPADLRPANPNSIAALCHIGII